MTVSPNSEVRLLQGVNLDNSYTNTLYFASIEEQSNFFDSKAKYRGIKYTYLREKESIRVNKNIKELLPCNYLMFRNTSFENKWFYGFIIEMEYLNNETTVISYEIDVMQTWFFEMNLKESYVEREQNNSLYALENVSYGNIVCSSIEKTGFFNEYGINVFASESFGSLYEPRFHSGLYEGAFSRFYNASNFNHLKEFLNSANSKPEAILALVVMPSEFYSTDNKDPILKVFYVDKPTTIGGYTPRHSKLLMYPYNYLTVDCGNNSAIYRYEWFNSSSCGFFLYGSSTTNPQIMLVPNQYNGTAGNNYSEKLVMEGFPQISFNASSYQQWIARNGLTTGLGLASSVVGGAAMGMSGNIVGGIASIAMSTASTMNEISKAQSMPDQNRGNNNGAIDVATKTKDFYFKKMQITPEYAKMLDDYFDRFGYACNRLKIPSISGGSHNYVKTSECTITGNILGNDLKTIKECFNKGITFWRNNDNIGNY